jgi:phosphatidylglycerol:prolipoprotein diacylglycerol transferase
MHALFGIPTPPGTSPDALLGVYPTQLFETVLGFVMFAILWRYRDHKHAEGVFSHRMTRRIGDEISQERGS